MSLTRAWPITKYPATLPGMIDTAFKEKTPLPGVTPGLFEMLPKF